MRYVLVLGLGVVGACAHASYDLMFIPRTGSYAHVRRYDPVSGIDFGTIGPGINATATAANLSSGRIAMSSATANASYIADYSTGQRIAEGSYPASSLAFSSDGRFLMGTTASSGWIFDTSRSTYGVINLGQITAVDFVANFSSPTYHIVGRNAAGGLVVNEYAIDSLTPLRTAVVEAGAGAYIVGKGAYVAARREIIFAVRPTSGGALSAYRLALSTAGVYQSMTKGAMTDGFNSASAPSIVPAHLGFYAVGLHQSMPGDNSTDLLEFGMSSAATAINYRQLPDGIAPGSQASIVLAPEPLPIGALSVALLPLLRRRKWAGIKSSLIKQ